MQLLRPNQFYILILGQGAINLDEAHVKILRSMFKCLQCCTNNHTFPSCPLLKNWVIKKKVRPDLTPESQPSGAARSAVTNNTESLLEGNASSSSHLETIQETRLLRMILIVKQNLIFSKMMMITRITKLVMKFILILILRCLQDQLGAFCPLPQTYLRCFQIDMNLMS